MVQWSVLVWCSLNRRFFENVSKFFKHLIRSLVFKSQGRRLNIRKKLTKNQIPTNTMSANRFITDTSLYLEANQGFRSQWSTTRSNGFCISAAIPNVIPQISMGNKLRYETNDTKVEAKLLEDSRHLLSIRDDKAILQIVLMPKENYKGNKPFNKPRSEVWHGCHPTTHHVMMSRSSTCLCGIYLFKVSHATPSINRCFYVSIPNIYLINFVLV